MWLRYLGEDDPPFLRGAVYEACSVLVPSVSFQGIYLSGSPDMFEPWTPQVGDWVRMRIMSEHTVVLAEEITPNKHWFAYLEGKRIKVKVAVQEIVGPIPGRRPEQYTNTGSTGSTVTQATEAKPTRKPTSDPMVEWLAQSSREYMKKNGLLGMRD